MSIHAQRGSFGGPIQELNVGNKKASLGTIDEQLSVHEDSHVQDVSLQFTPMVKKFQASTGSELEAGRRPFRTEIKKEKGHRLFEESKGN
jgi:hypothetical protein